MSAMAIPEGLEPPTNGLGNDNLYRFGVLQHFTQIYLGVSLSIETSPMEIARRIDWIVIQRDGFHPYEGRKL